MEKIEITINGIRENNNIIKLLNIDLEYTREISKDSDLSAPPDYVRYTNRIVEKHILIGIIKPIKDVGDNNRSVSIKTVDGIDIDIITDENSSYFKTSNNIDNLMQDSLLDVPKF